MEALCRFVGETCAELVRNGGTMGDIAVLYASHRHGTCDDLPKILLQELEQRGLLATWLSENRHSKRRYDITTDSITLSTIHSVKGMDYAHVFLVGLPPIEAGKTGYPEKLAYVGMTRARFGLYLCGVGG